MSRCATFFLQNYLGGIVAELREMFARSNNKRKEIITIEDDTETPTSVSQPAAVAPECSEPKRQDLHTLMAEFEDRAIKVLRDVWKLSSFRDNQLNIIESISSNVDTVCILPTGHGKSLCYQLAAVMAPKHKITIVVSPLIALMQDQIQSLKERNIPAVDMCSNKSQQQIYKLCQELCYPNCDYRLVYVSPERLESEQFIGVLQVLYKADRLAFVAVDEAHCISQWGDGFRNSYSRIGNVRGLIPTIPFIALTATATPAVKADIVAKLRMPYHNFYYVSFNRPEISYSCSSPSNPKGEILDILKLLPSGTDVIIYCFGRQRCESTALFINQNFQGVHHAKAYHGAVKKSERTLISNQWRSNDLHIICATTAFGMGIDKPSVRVVIHLEASTSLESYYQESGRGGRDGKPALSILFYSEKTFKMMERFIEKTTTSKIGVENKTRALHTFHRFCQQKTCRRRAILEHFGEARADTISCNGTCDACNFLVRKQFINSIKN